MLDENYEYAKGLIDFIIELYIKPCIYTLIFIVIVYFSYGIKGNYRSLSKKYLPFYLVEYDYKYNHRNSKSNLFEDFIKQALTDESCMLNYKPVKDSKEVVYG
jgi:hypothetical protein